MKGWIGGELRNLCAAEGLHADGPGEFPVARPLVMAADIADQIPMYPGDLTCDLDAGILHADNPSPSSLSSA